MVSVTDSLVNVGAGMMDLLYAIAKYSLLAGTVALVVWLLRDIFKYRLRFRVFEPIGGNENINIKKLEKHSDTGEIEEVNVGVVRHVPCRVVETKAAIEKIDGSPVIIMKKYKDFPLKTTMLRYATIDQKGKPELNLLKIGTSFIPMVVSNPVGEFKVVPEDIAFWQVQVGKTIRRIVATKQNWWDSWGHQVVPVAFMMGVVLALIILFKHLQGLNALPAAIQEGVKQGISEGIKEGLEMARGVIPGAPPA